MRETKMKKAISKMHLLLALMLAATLFLGPTTFAAANADAIGDSDLFVVVELLRHRAHVGQEDQLGRLDIGGRLGVAQLYRREFRHWQLPAGQGAELLHTAREAFTVSLHVTGGARFGWVPNLLLWAALVAGRNAEPGAAYPAPCRSPR